jgi:hypothetical protein
MTRSLFELRLDLERVPLWSLVIGVAALLPCLIGAFSAPDQFFRSYLSAYLFILGIGLGCLVLLMIFHVTGGAWGFVIRRFLEAGVRTLPLLALLIIPVGIGLTYLFRWARPEEVAADANLQWKQPYLNVPFWWVRAILYFELWTGLGYLLTDWARRQEETGDSRFAFWLEKLSAPGLVIYGVCIHFACVDWIMSLQTTFRSSIFGPLTASGQLLSALAFILILLPMLVDRPPLREVLSPDVLGDLGNLLLTLLIIWAYMCFFQFMLVWIAGLPYEISWYMDRERGGWQWVAAALLLFHFAIPFFALLIRSLKRNPVTLARVAGLVLFMHLVFVDFQVLPVFRSTSLAQHWMDFLMPIGMGGIWLAFFLWQLKQRPLVATHDENRAHALHLQAQERERTEETAILHG